MPKFGLWILQSTKGKLASYASNPGDYVLRKAVSCHYIEIHDGRIVDLTDYGNIPSKKSDAENA